MKKIILAIDGTRFSEGAFDFASRLNELQPILLTGIFLPEQDVANLWSYADGVGVTFIPPIETTNPELIQKNIVQFEKRCIGNGIDFRVHKDFFDLPLSELKTESRYADLLILGTEVFYSNMQNNSSNDYLRQVLRDVRCAVVLVPEKFDFPETIILAYDGSDEAVFAIKQFAYLFPELTTKETSLVYASKHEEEDFPDKIQMEELVARHYSDLILFKLDINQNKSFNNWVQEKKSAILVSGSYGRSGLSQLFKNSFIKDIIGSHRLPVFIAHQ